MPTTSSPIDPSVAPAPAAPAGGRGGPTDPSHDVELRRGILHTEVARPVAALLVAVFVAAIVAVPVGQAVAERVKGDESVLPDLFHQAPTRDSLRQFEEDLEKASYAREWVRPRLQAWLTGFGGYGNSKAVIGRDHQWLFYQPGLVAVGGPGLLDDRILAARRKEVLDRGSTPLHPDPRPAILDLHRFLAARGIALVIFPVPDKAALQPIELHGRASAVRGQPPAQNPDFARLVAELRAAGVVVFDPTPGRLDPGAPPRFLAQDTHWTPRWMEEVAGDLARLLTGRGLLPAPVAARTRNWQMSAREVTRVGDIVDMLGLPEGQKLYAARTITVDEVHDAGGAPFAPSERAELLLLGDSFTNVFSLGQMGWGEAAGLAPQLARALARDLDVIAQNDSGAYATRQLLWTALGDRDAAGAPIDRLADKKVVVWEFAARELAVGNWKPLDWSAATAAPGAP
jgi:alginate O-acetyltransferase complex protein AlgJ